jgi:hypothetical protein
VAMWWHRSARGGWWLTTEEMIAALSGFVMAAMVLGLGFKHSVASCGRRRGCFRQGGVGPSRSGRGSLLPRAR